MIENNDVFHIIQNFRRRTLITTLRELGGKACLREIVRRIAEKESGYYDRRLLKSIHVSLLQTHLPKMEGAGIIKYNEKTGVVQLLEFPRDAKLYLEFVERGDIPWSLYYLLLSIPVFIISLALGNLLATISSLCFLTTAIIHYSQTAGIVNETLTIVKRKLTKFYRNNK